MPVSAYVQTVLFFLLAAAALFASAGTFAIAVFWVYLAIFAAVFVASFILLDPDLARERMRPGGKKPPAALWLFSGVLFLHWIIAGLDRGRFHWSDTVSAVAPDPGPCCDGRQLRFRAVGDVREPVLFLGRPPPVRPRPIRGHERTLRGHSPSGLHGGHRHHAGKRHRARLLARGGVPGRSPHCRFCCTARSRRTDFFRPSCRAIGIMRHACAGGSCRAYGEGRQGFGSNFKCRLAIADSHKTYYGISSDRPDFIGFLKRQTSSRRTPAPHAPAVCRARPRNRGRRADWSGWRGAA